MPFLRQLFQELNYDVKQRLGVLQYFPDIRKACQREPSVFRTEKKMKRYLHMRGKQCLCLQLYTELYLLHNFSLQYILSFDMVKM